MAKIETVDRLREIYRQPKELAARKVMTKFEEHSRRFIELSPFLVISTTGSDGIGDAVAPRRRAWLCDGYGRQPHNRHSRPPREQPD